MKKLPYCDNVSERYRIPTYNKRIIALQERRKQEKYGNKVDTKLAKEVEELVLLERRAEEEKAFEKGI